MAIDHTSGAHKPADTSNNLDAMRAAFTGLAIGMGWQLAVIVLVGVIGGYQLDTLAGTSPLLTLIGLTLAMAGSILVIRHAMARINNFNVNSATDSSTDKSGDAS